MLYPSLKPESRLDRKGLKNPPICPLSILSKILEADGKTLMASRQTWLDGKDAEGHNHFKYDANCCYDNRYTYTNHKDRS